MAEMNLTVVSRQLSVLVFLLGGPLAGQTSLSIYSDGRVVVRRALQQRLEKGRNALTLELDGVDPAALFSPDTSVTVVSAVLRPATERGAALELAVGQTLAFVRGKGDTVRATVVRASPPQYRLPDGRLLLVEPGEPLFPPELVRTAPQVSLVLDVARARPGTEVAYVTDGAHWSAVYQVVLGAGRASVSGSATVASQRLRAESASVQLVAGSIGRARRAPASPMFSEFAARAAVAAPEPGSAGEEAVGETHVYTLPARINLEPGVPVATALFPRALAAVNQELIVPGTLPFRGYLQNSPGEPNRVPVQVWYTLSRPRATPFGERPLPGGTVQIYQADSAGRVQLVGEAGIDHTAPGRDLRVQSGDAFDVTAERIQTDYLQEQIPPIRRGFPVRQRFTASYRVTLSNAKPDPVTVDVRETRGGPWVVVTSSVPSEKLSATEVRFRVAVPAKGEATVTYTVQVEA
jgi:hypothetical protein